MGGAVTIHYQNERVTLHCGDALAVLREMPSESVNCVMTSPPYFGLRDYGIDGQYGHEPTPQGFAETLREMFREVRRVLAKDGTVWLNLGDSYAGSASGYREGSARADGQVRGDGHSRRNRNGTPACGLPTKNLIGIPWRAALALQDDGWILRNDIIWHKPNAMPHSVKDRLTNRYEHVFLLTRSKKYHFDLDAIREPLLYPEASGTGIKFGGKKAAGYGNISYSGKEYVTDPGKGKNPGDVWSITTKPFPEAHFATYPPDLARRCIAAGCPEGGTVLDPFSGAGTTGMAALEQDKKYIGIDLNPEYLDLSLRTRLKVLGAESWSAQ